MYFLYIIILNIISSAVIKLVFIPHGSFIILLTISVKFVSSSKLIHDAFVLIDFILFPYIDFSATLIANPIALYKGTQLSISIDPEVSTIEIKFPRLPSINFSESFH